MTPLQFSLHSKLEYLRSLVQHFDRAQPGDRILLMSMTLEPGDPRIGEVLESLEAAAKRGVHVLFSIDARSFLETRRGVPGPLWFTPELSAGSRAPYGALYGILERLNGYETCRAVITNRPGRQFTSSVAGRSHIKAAIINDQVFVGGCNLDASDKIDLMISWHDRRTSDDLYELLSRGITTGNIREALSGVDRTLPLDSTASLIIDAGVPDQSLILKNAFGLIDAAQKWLVFSCQYFPNSVTAQRLLAARKRGVNTRLAYSNIKGFNLIGQAIQHLNRIIEHTRLPRDMFKGELPADYPFLHAKLIACDQGVMIGSHNYVLPGVRFGTAEIAFKSSDVELAKQAAEKLSAQLRALRKQQS